MKKDFGNTVRTHKDKLLCEYVVDPAGRIKTAYFERNVRSPLLNVVYQTANKRIVAITGVFIDPIMAQQGWVLLRDLYEAEGRLVDYDTYLLFREGLRGRDISGEDIGDEYLPDALLDRRRNYRAEQKRAQQLPPPQRASADKKAK